MEIRNYEDKPTENVFLLKLGKTLKSKMFIILVGALFLLGCQGTTQLIEEDVDKLPEDSSGVVIGVQSTEPIESTPTESTKSTETSKVPPPEIKSTEPIESTPTESTKSTETSKVPSPEIKASVTEKTNINTEKCQNEFSKGYSVKDLFTDEKSMKCLNDKLKQE